MLRGIMAIYGSAGSYCGSTALGGGEEGRPVQRRRRIEHAILHRAPLSPIALGAHVVTDLGGQAADAELRPRRVDLNAEESREEATAGTRGVEETSSAGDYVAFGALHLRCIGARRVLRCVTV